MGALKRTRQIFKDGDAPSNCNIISHNNSINNLAIQSAWSIFHFSFTDHTADNYRHRLQASYRPKNICKIYESLCKAFEIFFNTNMFTFNTSPSPRAGSGICTKLLLLLAAFSALTLATAASTDYHRAQLANTSNNLHSINRRSAPPTPIRATGSLHRRMLTPAQHREKANEQMELATKHRVLRIGHEHNAAGARAAQTHIGNFLQEHGHTLSRENRKEMEKSQRKHGEHADKQDGLAEEHRRKERAAIELHGHYDEHARAGGH